MLIFKRRIAEQILKRIKNRGLIVILGPRQAGKTTLVKTLLKNLGHNDAYFNCEQSDVRRAFILGDTDALNNLINGRTLVAFDEAQTIPNIGKILKLFHD
ncbi:ATPase, partial [Candidatus Kaiserbacteria bacterium CG_4_8_14_3_um_filter_38_9]